MGGSGPVIDGGMTEEQYRKLQMEERQFQKQMEEEAFARAEEAETKRMEMEQANVDRLRAQEDAEARAVQQSELSLQGEVDRLEEDDDDDNMGAVDFYGALSQGQSQTDTARPE